MSETPINRDITEVSSWIWGRYLKASLVQQMQYTPTMAADFNNTPIDNNKQFISLETSFLDQLHQHPDYFEGQNKYVLQEKMRLSADVLLNCVPDKVSLQVTEEGSLYYTILKNDITIYFEHYLVDEFDGADEALVTVFIGDEMIFNYAGALHETVNALNLTLAKHSIALPVFH